VSLTPSFLDRRDPEADRRHGAPAPPSFLANHLLRAGGALALVGALMGGLAGCAAPTAPTALAIAAGTGAQPTLPAPQHSLLPTVNIAPARGWAAGAKPQAAAGLQVARFANQLDHPRWLYTLPNGDVLVAESNAPERPDDATGLKGWVAGLVMRRAGAVTPSANRITLLRDSDGDGVADLRSVLLSGLNSPFGMVLVGDSLFVANTDAVLRFPYHAGDLQISQPGTTLLALPAGPINHHWTKNLIASADGSKLYVTVGSNSNVAERGLAVEEGRAAIWEVDIASGAHRVYASGLRNPNGLAWAPGALWTVVNERDELGDDLVPDYLSSVQDGGFYGWPYSYFGDHVDDRVQPPRPDRVASAIVPDYALGAHTASLGLAFSAENSLTPDLAKGMFIGQHGSWNRRVHSGYKVVFVPFDGGRPAADTPRDVLTGFLDGDGQAQGRPVGVVFDRQGALLVADDVGNVVWRVTAEPQVGPGSKRP
jgi:glucose/arabinose dehydrogenase